MRDNEDPSQGVTHINKYVPDMGSSLFGFTSKLAERDRDSEEKNKYVQEGEKQTVEGGRSEGVGGCGRGRREGKRNGLPQPRQADRKDRENRGHHESRRISRQWPNTTSKKTLSGPMGITTDDVCCKQRPCGVIPP